MHEGTFSLVQQHPPLKHFTLSSSLMRSATVFSLSENTEISQEKYSDAKMYIVHAGSGIFLIDEEKINVKENDVIIIGKDTLFGVSVNDENGLVYTENTIGENYMVSDLIKPGEVFSLKELVPYQENTIVNADIISNEKMKFVVMSFDEGTGLTPHKAPGDAIVFALEGKAVIGYEGQEYSIEAGQQFHFAKNGEHSVTANGKFKMALLLVF